MGSYAPFLMGRYELLSTKNGASGELLSLFRETDRRFRKSDELVPEEVELLEYSTSVSRLIDRLEVMGLTEAACQSEFEAGLAAHIEELSEEPESEYLQRQLEFLRGMSYGRWLEAFDEIRREGMVWTWDPNAHADPLLNYMLDPNETLLGFPAPDLRFALRAALSTVDGRTTVRYDLTGLARSGYIWPDADLAADAALHRQADLASSAPLIVLTEGSTDAQILQSALRILAPHLSESFSFIDFGTARVPGGTSNLVNLAAALAGAGVANRVLVVLDNDTAGREALRDLGTRRLGKNIRATLLPALRLAVRYPTLGPSGTVLMDVNGLAASIEMYCGRDVLLGGDGRLVPVQWTGYSSRMQAYQGELLSKKAIGERIRIKLTEGQAGVREKQDFSGLRMLVEMLKREAALFGRD